MIVVLNGIGTNVASLIYALKRLDQQVLLTDDPKFIIKGSHVIIPGVSTAQRAMFQLKQKRLEKLILNLAQPVLGICSGMQILFESSEEGSVSGLGIFSGSVKKMLMLPNYTLPHMGWNTLKKLTLVHPLLENIPANGHVYYSHSFAADLNENSLATSEYSSLFSAMVLKNNFVGMQFHPERSGKIGAQLLMNFINWNGQSAI